MASRYRCTLTTRDGAARRVDAFGITIGREPDCDIVIDDPTVSRRHALVRVEATGAELVVLGRTPIQVNGKPVDRRHRLVDRDRIEIATLELVVALELEPVIGAPTFHLLIKDANYGVRHSPFTVGGGSDDIILDGVPEHALTFHVTGTELFLETSVTTASRNGVPLPESEELEALEVGDVIACGGTTIKIGAPPVQARTTVTGSQPLPTKVVVEMLPRGGRVVFSLPSGDHCVYLADRRLDLIAALLRPPSDYRPGDYIPDDVLRPLVWPGNPTVIRSDINVHIARCRKDLVAVGLAGPRLLQRSPGGGATRLALATDCEVVFL